MPWAECDDGHPCGLCGATSVCTYNVTTKIHDCTVCIDLRFDQRKQQKAWGPMEHRPISEAHERNMNATKDADLQRHATQHGVSANALARLNAAVVGDALHFPMFNSAADVVGVRTIAMDGKRGLVEGSEHGLYLGAGRRASPDVMITAGPLDTAAMLTMGFDTIGMFTPDRTEQIAIARIEWENRENVVVWNRSRLPSMLMLCQPRCLRRCTVVLPPIQYGSVLEWHVAGGADAVKVLVRVDRVRRECDPNAGQIRGESAV